MDVLKIIEVRQTPFKRFGHPDELQGALIWLLSDASKFVTGSMICVDGGFSIFGGVLASCYDGKINREEVTKMLFLTVKPSSLKNFADKGPTLRVN